MDWLSVFQDGAWCELLELRRSFDQHPQLWVVALGAVTVIIIPLLYWLVSKFRRRPLDLFSSIISGTKSEEERGSAFAAFLWWYLKPLLGITTFVSVTVVLAAIGLLALPQPGYCPIVVIPTDLTTSASDYVPLARPGFLYLEQESAEEFVYSDSRESWLRFWPGRHAVEDGFGRLYGLYRDLKRGARNDLARQTVIESDRRPTEDSPYFVLSWQSRDGTDIYECARLKRVNGKVYISRVQIVAPIHNNPFTADNYRQIARTFLAA